MLFFPPYHPNHCKRTASEKLTTFIFVSLDFRRFKPYKMRMNGTVHNYFFCESNNYDRTITREEKKIGIACVRAYDAGDLHQIAISVFVYVYLQLAV